MVLIVDDEPHIRSLVKSILQREHYQVLEAGDGSQALEICQESGSAIDLLLTDIVMPKLDGIRLVEQVFPAYPNMRFLYMSGKCDVEAVQRDIREKGCGFIRKPFEISTLIKTIRDLLQSAAPKKPVVREGQSAKMSSIGGSTRH
ncbi:MAG TPA: response regulator [Bryobacteraceae bacterium]